MGQTFAGSACFELYLRKCDELAALMALRPRQPRRPLPMEVSNFIKRNVFLEQWDFYMRRDG